MEACNEAPMPAWSRALQHSRPAHTRASVRLPLCAGRTVPGRLAKVVKGWPGPQWMRRYAGADGPLPAPSDGTLSTAEISCSTIERDRSERLAAADAAACSSSSRRSRDGVKAVPGAAPRWHGEIPKPGSAIAFKRRQWADGSRAAHPLKRNWRDNRQRGCRSSVLHGSQSRAVMGGIRKLTAPPGRSWDWVCDEPCSEVCDQVLR
jgi:hypothetical protein